MKVLSQANSFLTSSKYADMAQLLQMNETMNTMQSQIKTLSSTSTNSTISKRKYYCWWCRINFTHGSKAWSSNKSRHKDESYYNKVLGGIEKGCKWRLGAIMNKIKTSTPKIILINNIGTPPIITYLCDPRSIKIPKTGTRVERPIAHMHNTR